MTAQTGVLLRLDRAEVCIGSTRFGPFSFDVLAGERIAILGPSGAGKSSLLKVISGEYATANGNLSLGGKPVESLGPAALSRVLAVLPQSYQNTFAMPVELVIGLGRLGRVAAGDSNQIVRQSATLARAEHLLHRTTADLSGGELARVHLARVFAQLWDVSGGLLLVDEPLAALDPGLALELFDRLSSFTRLRGHTLIAVLHDVQLALQEFDRLILIRQGQLYADCPSSVDVIPILERLFEVHFRKHHAGDLLFISATATQGHS